MCTGCAQGEALSIVGAREKEWGQTPGVEHNTNRTPFHEVNEVGEVVANLGSVATRTQAKPRTSDKGIANLKRPKQTVT